MDEAHFGGRSADRPEEAEVNGALRRGRGGDRCLSALHAAAARRDDCLYALQPTIPYLTRSSLHRCLQRHGIGRLPDVEGDKPAKKKFKIYLIGYFHIDIDVAEVRTEQGKLHMFVAIDRTSKFAFVELHEKANTAVGQRAITVAANSGQSKVYGEVDPTFVSSSPLAGQLVACGAGELSAVLNASGQVTLLDTDEMAACASQ